MGVAHVRGSRSLTVEGEWWCFCVFLFLVRFMFYAVEKMKTFVGGFGSFIILIVFFIMVGLWILVLIQLFLFR